MQFGESLGKNKGQKVKGKNDVIREALYIAVQNYVTV